MPKNNNPYMMSGTNPYRQQENPYDADSYGEEPDPQPRPRATEPNDGDSETQAKTGFLHAVAGRSPVAEGDDYMDGYDTGSMVRASALARDGVQVVWMPFVAGGIRGLASTGHEVIACSHGVEGAEWTVYDRVGVAIRRGRSASIAGVEDALISIAKKHRFSGAFNFDQAVADVLADNPGLSFFAAVDIARQSQLLADSRNG